MNSASSNNWLDYVHTLDARWTIYIKWQYGGEGWAGKTVLLEKRKENDAKIPSLS